MYLCLHCENWNTITYMLQIDAIPSLVIPRFKSWFILSASPCSQCLRYFAPENVAEWTKCTVQQIAVAVSHSDSPHTEM